MNQIMELTLEVTMVANDPTDALRRALADGEDVLRLAGASVALFDEVGTEPVVFGETGGRIRAPLAPSARSTVGDSIGREVLAEVLLEWTADLYDRMADEDLRSESRSLVVPLASTSNDRPEGFMAIVASRPAILMLLAILTRHRLNA